VRVLGCLGRKRQSVRWASGPYRGESDSYGRARWLSGPLQFCLRGAGGWGQRVTKFGRRLSKFGRRATKKNVPEEAKNELLATEDLTWFVLQILFKA